MLRVFLRHQAGNRMPIIPQTHIQRVRENQINRTQVFWHVAQATHWRQKFQDLMQKEPPLDHSLRKPQKDFFPPKPHGLTAIQVFYLPQVLTAILHRNNDVSVQLDSKQAAVASTTPCTISHSRKQFQIIAVALLRFVDFLLQMTFKNRMLILICLISRSADPYFWVSKPNRIVQGRESHNNTVSQIVSLTTTLIINDSCL